MRGPGGTPGGVSSFGLGLTLAASGVYILGQRLAGGAGRWSVLAPHAFRLSLLALLVGAGLLYFDRGSRAGFALTASGAAIVLVGVLVNPRLYFEPTSLVDTMLMLILLASGLGLVVRSLRPH